MPLVLRISMDLRIGEMSKPSTPAVRAYFSGELLIVYRKSAEKISSADEEIKIPTHLSPLLPLLAASFAWAEELPELSEIYLKSYRELSDTIRKEVRKKLSPAYAHNGWA